MTLALTGGEGGTPTDKPRKGQSGDGNNGRGFAGQEEIFEAASTAVGEGVKLISGAVQKLVQKIKVEGRGLVVRVNLPNRHVLTLKLDKALVQDAANGDNNIASDISWDVAKECTFSGLAVRLASTVADSTDEALASIGSLEDGCNGSIALAWSLSDDENSVIDTRVSLHGNMSVWVSPAVLPVLTAALEATAQPHPRAGHTSVHPLSKSVMAASDAAASNDIVRALQLPDGEHMLEVLAHVPGSHVEEASCNLLRWADCRHNIKCVTYYLIYLTTSVMLRRMWTNSSMPSQI